MKAMRNKFNCWSYYENLLNLRVPILVHFPYWNKRLTESDINSSIVEGVSIGFAILNILLPMSSELFSRTVFGNTCI